jgi:hypothetical protein
MISTIRQRLWIGDGARADNIMITAPVQSRTYLIYDIVLHIRYDTYNNYHHLFASFTPGPPPLFILLSHSFLIYHTRTCPSSTDTYIVLYPSSPTKVAVCSPPRVRNTMVLFQPLGYGHQFIIVQASTPPLRLSTLGRLMRHLPVLAPIDWDFKNSLVLVKLTLLLSQSSLSYRPGFEQPT